jgi:hydrogenase nickel incorporation protein HypA/HybF
VHELSVASAIVSTVRDALPGRTVEAVEVTVGAMSGVVPQALEFAWDVATTGTALAGSSLEIDLVPTTLYCVDCDAVVTPEIGFACPSCGALSGDIRSGRELEVRAARVRDDEVVDA